MITIVLLAACALLSAVIAGIVRDIVRTARAIRRIRACDPTEIAAVLEAMKEGR